MEKLLNVLIWIFWLIWFFIFAFSILPLSAWNESISHYLNAMVVFVLPNAKNPASLYMSIASIFLWLSLFVRIIKEKYLKKAKPDGM